MYRNLTRDPGLPVDQPTSSYWQQPLHAGLAGTCSKDLPRSSDIVVIGSGITGLSVCHTLLSGFDGSVSVLEAREVCSGATGRNGGRINAVAVLDYDKYRRKLGDEPAKKIVRFELEHYAQIKDAAESLGADLFAKSEVRQVETVAGVFSEAKLQQLKNMLANFEAAFPDLKGRWSITESAKEHGIKNAKGALVGTSGAAWPYRFVTDSYANLLERYADRFTIESHTPALAISRDGDQEHPYTITTPRGSMRARHIIHCTEGHSSHLLQGLRGILVPRIGQMMVIAPPKAIRDSNRQRSWSFYYDTAFDYATQNRETGDIFIGGGDIGEDVDNMQRFGNASDAEEMILPKTHLAGVLPIVFEDAFQQDGAVSRIKASWTGVMCNSLDGVPMVGMVPQEALSTRSQGDGAGAEWISAGYGGYGMVNSWLCGKAVAQRLLGQDVSSYLPDQYNITAERIIRLTNLLDNITGTKEHLKTLL